MIGKVKIFDNLYKLSASKRQMLTEMKNKHVGAVHLAFRIKKYIVKIATIDKLKRSKLKKWFGRQIS